MELTKGMTFSGKHFTGKILIIEVDKANNKLIVNLTKKCETFRSNWTESWDLKHFIWGFESGEYYPIVDEASVIKNTIEEFQNDLKKIDTFITQNKFPVEKAMVIAIECANIKRSFFIIEKMLNHK
jgi:hypothetical protein